MVFTRYCENIRLVDCYEKGCEWIFFAHKVLQSEKILFVVIITASMVDEVKFSPIGCTQYLHKTSYQHIYLENESCVSSADCGDTQAVEGK
jgi:hypothetical protein